MNEIKRIQMPLELKADQEGMVQAVFSTFDVVDKGGDIVLASAFTHGQQVPMTWAHRWDMPVGKGTILVEPGRAVFDGRFFLETQAGAEAYKTVKAMGDLQDWSWGFRVIDAAYEQRDGEFVRIIKRADVFEVSPVLIGEGENTSTLGIKTDQKGVDPGNVSSDTAPEDEAWSAPTLGDFTSESWDDLSDAKKRRIAKHFAWAASMPPESFGDLKLPHHRPSDGKVVWRGVVASGNARMGARGGVDIPEADMAIVEAHLAPHYRAFGKEPPWEKGLSYTDQAEQALAAVSDLVERSKALATLRAKEGRVLSTANRNRLASLKESLAAALADIEELLASTEPEKSFDPLALFVEYQKINARLNGVAIN